MVLGITRTSPRRGLWPGRPPAYGGEGREIACEGLARRCRSLGGDQVDGIVVEFGEALVEAGESAVVRAGELRQVGVGHLAVADDSVHRDVAVWQVVWPELVTGVAGHRRHDCPCRLRRL